jgi:hypothetical protein
MTHTYTTTGGTFSENVCAICFDQLTARDAFDSRLRHVVDLQRDDRYDEALACLDEVLEASSRLDHDRWVARHVAAQRADIFLDAGRYTEMEQACKVWADLGITDVWERWLQGAAMAQALDALGRTGEGLAVLEEALRHRDPKDVRGAWGYLGELATLSEKLGRPVDPEFRSLAEETAAANGVAMPERESLGQAILALAEAIRGPCDDDDS